MSGVKVATAHSHPFQNGALSFISCASGRESLPLDENESPQQTEYKTETKKKKFHPLRNLRRMFRRKGRRSSISTDSYQVAVPDNSDAIPPANLEQRSCSTSRLQEENSTQNFMSQNLLNPGLSLSHDSIFTPDRADSGLSSSDLGNSSLSITVMTPPSREYTMKSQSSCSETSLLSIGSSEVEELSPVRNRKISDLDVGVTTYKLSHSAAKHKMAVRPRRNHGAPRSRRKAMASKSPLPTTLEVNEERLIGKSSSPIDLELETSPWSQPSHPEPTDVPLEMKDDHDGKEEESPGQRTESFFGRFLSRRSEKKKKGLQESVTEEGSTEDKSGLSVRMFSKGSKSPNRRQRVEPMEIPSSPRSLPKNEKDAASSASSAGRFTSSSTSPPRSFCWPSQITSRSMSPPKVVWSNDSKDTVADTQADWEKVKTSETSPSESAFKDMRNPNFVRELTNSVSLFAKDESGKRKKNGDEEETALKIRRQHSEHEIPRKKTTEENTQNARTETSEEETTQETCRIQVAVPKVTAKEEPRAFRTRLSFDDYENADAVDKLKTQSTNSGVEEELGGGGGEGGGSGGGGAAEEKEEEVPAAAAAAEEEEYQVTKVNSKIKENVESVSVIEVSAPERVVKEQTNEVEMAVIEVKKTENHETTRKPEVQVVRRVKPVISQKPKDLKRLANNSGFTKTTATSKPAEVSPEVKSDRVEPNLVERRKSELLLLTGDPGRLGLREGSAERQSPEDGPKSTSKDDWTSGGRAGAHAPEDAVEEGVVLRRKSHAGHSEDQPELMKVFARRSLKVRETEKMAEELQRSRDSDKENEVIETRKERKKSSDGDERWGEGGDEGKERKMSGGANDVKVNVTPLKPEVASRKNVVQRYERSLSENNGKKEETDGSSAKPAVLEESNLNKMRKTDATGCVVTKDDRADKEEETVGKGAGGGEVGGGTGNGGFKRIQQRKAEWERRAQQGAK